MKILKLKFKNLNSLYGEWSIDFTDPAYAQNGIFALTGPTGAGKTTILDAICLALYGSTARLDKITKSTNDIMSRQTAESSAEVEFSSQAGRFLCRWSQRRSRGKVDGALQETQQEIAELATDGTYKILATKKKEFDALVEEKTGMDFDRFLRSMLLAQGKFDNFLKADAKTKSAVLEKITGTSIYSEISQRVYVRSTNEENKLCLLNAETQGILLLNKQECADIATQIKQTRQEEAQLQQQLKQVESEIQWHRHIAQLKVNVEQAEQNILNLNENIKQFEPKRTQLALALKAQSLEASYSSVKTLRDEQNRAYEQQRTLQTQLPVLQQNLEQKTNLRETQAQHIETLKKEWDAQQAVWKEVRALDVQINGQQNLVATSKTRVDEVKTKQQSVKVKQQQLQQQIERYQQGLQHSEQYLQAHQQDQLLIENIAAWRHTFEQIQKEIAIWKQEVDTYKKRELSLQTLQDSLAKAEQEKVRLSQTLAQLQTKQDEQKRALNDVLQNQTAEYYQCELDHAREKKALIQNIHSVAAIRDTLEDNKPCPVCGSTHHPYREGIPAADKFDKEIEALSQRLRQIKLLEEQLGALSDQTKGVQSELAIKENTIAHQQAQMQLVQQELADYKAQLHTEKSELKEKRAALLDELQAFQVNEFSTATFDTLKQRAEQWQMHTKNVQETQVHIKPLTEKMAALLAEQHILSNTVAEVVQQTDEQQKVLESLLETRQRLFGTQDVNQVEATFKSRLSAAEQVYKEAEQAQQQAKTSLDNAQVRLTQVGEGLAQRQIDLNNAQNTFEQGLQAQNFADELAFIQASLSREQCQHLQMQAQVLDEQQAKLKTLLQERTERLMAEERKQLSSKPLIELEELYQQLMPKLRAYTEQAATLEERLRQDESNKARFADKQEAIHQQEKEVLRWKNLRSLIGSADGSVYRTFAQGLTFELMINYANEQLRAMSDRYLLLHDRENVLSLNVLDAYQAGEVRSVRNLSGGESFMVSLALALGLSKMSSQKIRVDSLFLDEGFGTLDEEALESALDTLSALHEENKLIGVISHVPALKNRISTQIQVQPKHDGRSGLSGPGVTRG